MKLSIEPHDLEIKRSKTVDFLEKGHKVKVTIILRGREMAFLNRAYNFLKAFQESLGENIQKIKEVERMGKRISVLLCKTPRQ